MSGTACNIKVKIDVSRVYGIHLDGWGVKLSVQQSQAVATDKYPQERQVTSPYPTYPIYLEGGSRSRISA
jgi:agmatine/peptidylarginine deiminase